MRSHKDSMDDVSRLDPIDGERLTASWSDSRAKQALFEEVTSMSVDTLAPVHQSSPVKTRPRKFGLAAAVAAAVAIFVVVAQGVLFSSSPAYAIRPLPNGVLEISVLPELRDGDALAAELRSFGIDVEIVTLPSSPSLVGDVEIFRDGIPAGLTFGADGTSDVFQWQIDPNEFTGRLTVELHVAAEGDEPYSLAAEVFEPGEALGGLHCALGQPLMAADVAPYLVDLGLEAVWYEVTPTSDPSITNETEVAVVPSGEVLYGAARDANTVWFRVRPEGVTLTDYTAYLSDVPCTPQQADAWR